MQRESLLPSAGFVRIADILKVIPVSKTTWWNGVRSGRFPQPTRALGERIAAWRAEDIRALIDALNAGVPFPFREGVAVQAAVRNGRPVA